MVNPGRSTQAGSGSGDRVTSTMQVGENKAQEHQLLEGWCPQNKIGGFGELMESDAVL